MQPKAKLESEPLERPQPQSTATPKWNLGHRLTFRFIFAYFVLYLFPSPLSEISLFDPIVEKYESIWHKIVPWVAKHILHLSYDITVFSTGSGSGDTTYDYVKVVCFILLATAGTVIWSAIDRNRTSYPRLHQWLRVYVRFTLAATMIGYGSFKVFQSQFPSPPLDRMVQSFGDASPMGLLWTFMGASKPYNLFIGLAEIAGGVLLITPWTAALGSLICFTVMCNVFMLNMCYDVPVKLYSFNLLLLSVFLIYPELKRLINFFVLNRVTQPADIRPLFVRRWKNRAAVVVAILFIAFSLGSSLWTSYGDYKIFAREKSPLYGIWIVDELKIDGEIKPALVTDETRWRRAIFDLPEWFTFQLMDGSRQRFRLDLDLEKKSMSLTRFDDPSWKADFVVERQGTNALELQGTFDGKQVQAKLSRPTDQSFLLTSRGFHWINEYPFNR